MEPISPSKSKIPIIGFIYNPIRISITLISILLLLSIGAYLFLGSKKSYFTVVIDCGSTGTRVNVYEWIKKGSFGNQDLPFLIRSYPNNSINYHSMQTEPGLDKFVGNFSGIRVSIEPLIRWAEQWVPKEKQLETAFFVLATAGLRRLKPKDSTWVLRNIETVLKESSFMYRQNWVRVLSGKEEAYYGWAALNYRIGVLKRSTNVPTLGLLDLGGSSLQVVAEVDESKEGELFMRTNIGPLKHRVLAYSWPDLGLNEAFDRTVVMMSHSKAVRESRLGSFEVAHPCLGYDFVRNYSCGGCFGLENSTDLRSFYNESSIVLAGEPNWEYCKSLARAVAVNTSNVDSSSLGDSTNSKQGIELLNLTAIAPSVSRYHALSGFFAIYSSLGLQNQRANLSNLWEKAEELCSRSWSNNNYYNAQYCFRVPFLISLIEDALRISNKEIIFGPGDISWTLGAALIEGEFLWHSFHNNNLIRVLNYRNFGVVSSSIFLFVFLIGVLYIVYVTKLSCR